MLMILSLLQIFCSQYNFIRFIVKYCNCIVLVRVSHCLILLLLPLEYEAKFEQCSLWHIKPFQQSLYQYITLSLCIICCNPSMQFQYFLVML